VLLEPAMLVRDDLKQYTADACLALLVLALTSRLERQWSQRGLAGLSVAVWGGMLFSDAAAFVGAAAFTALCIVQLARRAWHRLAAAVVAGACTAVLMLGVYEGFDARAVVPGLTHSPHFRTYYLPLTEGLHAAITFVTSHFGAMHAIFSLGPVWLALPLFLAGLVTIFRLGRPATAVAIAALWPEMLVGRQILRQVWRIERDGDGHRLIGAAARCQPVGILDRLRAPAARPGGLPGAAAGRHRSVDRDLRREQDEAPHVSRPCHRAGWPQRRGAGGPGVPRRPAAPQPGLPPGGGERCGGRSCRDDARNGQDGHHAASRAPPGQPRGRDHFADMHVSVLPWVAAQDPVR